MMKKSTLTLALLLLAAGSFAQDAQHTPKPDYSRPTLLRIVSEEITPPPRPHRFSFPFGAIDFTAFGQRFHVPYLPVPMLAGSRPITAQILPDAFSLTNTEIARPPRTWRDQRGMSQELRRIERMEREREKKRVRVVVQSPPSP